MNIANPVIPGFVLPKTMPGATQNLVRIFGGRALKPPSKSRDRHSRRNKQMDVVRHHNPGVKFVEIPFFVADHNALGNQPRNPGIHQPARAAQTFIQFPVSRHKRSPSRRLRNQNFLPPVHRQRSVQPPRKKNRNSVGLTVRQFPAVFKHLMNRSRTGGTACPTFSTELSVRQTRRFSL